MSFGRPTGFRPPPARPAPFQLPAVERMKPARRFGRAEKKEIRR
ncbi:hypothetical protein BN871_BK_00180 [Paenibacillus sp. P22]|nr:hypothetical protein BN871_BK_00180 [Paenibacillus sp. P22]